MRRIMPVSARTRTSHLVLERVAPAIGLTPRQITDAVGQYRQTRLDQALARDGEFRECFQTGDEAALLPVQRQPPTEMIVAEVEDIGGARHDGHLLRGGDVVDVGGGEGGIDRLVGVWVIDHMQLGTADLGREAGPSGAVFVELQAGGVDQEHQIVQVLAQGSMRQRRHAGEQRLEHRTRAQRIGIRQRRAFHDRPAQMVQLGRVTIHHRDGCPQAADAGQLGDDKSDELRLGRQRAHMLVRSVLFDQGPKRRPRETFKDPMEDGILMRHHAVRPRVSIRVSAIGRSRIHRRALYKLFKPDSRGSSPRMTKKGDRAQVEFPWPRTIGRRTIGRLWPARVGVRLLTPRQRSPCP